MSQYEYDLVLQPDINTRGHTQWWGGTPADPAAWAMHGASTHACRHAVRLIRCRACNPRHHQPRGPCGPVAHVARRFFFAVSNTRAGQAYRFNLVNLLKADSLYNAGMLPLVHSERRMAQEVRMRMCMQPHACKSLRSS